MTSVLIADDHPVVSLGVKTFLEQRNYRVSAVFANGIEAYNKLLSDPPDVAILDVSMPGMTGIEILKKLQSVKSSTKVILLTLHNERSLFDYAVKLGVSGFLLKEFAMDELDLCLENVSRNKQYFSTHLEKKLKIDGENRDTELTDNLTFAERKILELVAKQKSTKEIAHMLFISEKTVETHRRHIIQKLNIPPGNQSLVLWAIKNMPGG